MVSGQKQTGFTIVELLIVIVVIAILAAITIVAYNGIQNRAADAAVQSDLNALMKKSGIHNVDNSKHFTSVNEILNFKASKSGYATSPTTAFNLTSCFVSSGGVYGVAALSKSGKIFYVTTNDGTVKTYTGAWPNNSGDACVNILDIQSGPNYNGYSSTDTSTGPWRNWVGGN